MAVMNVKQIVKKILRIMVIFFVVDFSKSNNLTMRLFGCCYLDAI